MKATYATAHTRIYLCPLPVASQPATHTAAIASLVKAVFGENVNYQHYPDGAPRIVPVIDECISVSHGAGLGVLAVSGAQSVGVDVECWREQLHRVSSRFMNAGDPDRTPEHLLRCWTAKEAVYKAAHTQGLALLDIKIAGEKAYAAGKEFRLQWFGCFPTLIAVAESEPL